MQDLDEVPSARCFVEDLLTKTSSMCTRSVNLVKSECNHQFSKIASNPWREERGEELLKVEFPFLHRYWTVKMTKRRTETFFMHIFSLTKVFFSFDKDNFFLQRSFFIFTKAFHFLQRYFFDKGISCQMKASGHGPQTGRCVPNGRPERFGNVSVCEIQSWSV